MLLAIHFIQLMTLPTDTRDARSARARAIALTGIVSGLL